MDETTKSEPVVPAVGIPVERMVGRPADERCDRCRMLLLALEAIAQPLTPMQRDSMARMALAEHDDLRTRSQKLADAGFTRRPSLRALEMREALELIAAPVRPDGTWNRDREACRQLAAEALGRYEDDKPHNV